MWIKKYEFIHKVSKVHRLCNRELTKHTIENKTEYQTNPVTNHRFEYSGIYT